jgi:hypothetical protein
MRWTRRLGSEISPMPVEFEACDEVTAVNPPVVWLQNVSRSNAIKARTEFSKRWICKRSLQHRSNADRD